MITTQVSMPFTASASGAASGLVGTIGVQVLRSDGSVAIARTISNIIELVAGSGLYAWSVPSAPSVPGDYTVVWDTGADSPSWASEDLTVVIGSVATSGGTGAPPYPTIGTISAQAQQAQRIVRGQPFTAQFIFGLDAPDTTPDADTEVHVSVVNAEGYLVVSDEEATLGTINLGTGFSDQPVAQFALAPSTTPQRDVFTCIWTATIGGNAVTLVSLVDVCDSRLFPLSDYSQYPELAELTLTAQQYEDGRRFAEDFIERECGCAFTGRFGIEQHVIGDRGRGGAWYDSYGDGYGTRVQRGRGRLHLEAAFVQALRGITRTWVDESGAQHTYSVNLDWATLDMRTSTIRYNAGAGATQWDGLWGNLTVTFEHGAWIADVRRVCSILARYRLLNGPIDARATQMSVEGGGNVNLLTPGLMGSITGIPEVDVFIQRYNQRVEGFLG